MDHHLVILADGLYTDKGTTHSYLEVYEDLFRPLRDTASEVLELGVDRGGSLELWCRYFKHANITGIDLHEREGAAECARRLSERVSCITGDAYAHDMLEKLAGKLYDVIIDDGPHTLESQQFAAREYSKFLKPGSGILVIEDVQKIEDADRIIACFPHPSNAKVVDLRCVKDRYDDVLIVYRG